MPNVKGGKNYKKSKHATFSKPVMIERKPGQMYGRIIRNVGGDRMVVFCNDAKVRTCHICGSLRKKVWMKVGDIILISLRDLDETIDENKKDKSLVGDIIAKYDDDLISDLKKTPDFNHLLLKPLETQDGKVLADLAGADEKKQSAILGDDDDGGIEFDRGSEDEEESGSGSDEEEKKKAAKRKAEAAVEKGRARKELERSAPDDDINIDDI